MWTRNTGVNPYSSTISVLGSSFTCITLIIYDLRINVPSEGRSNYGCVLLKDTSAATGQAGIRTHILTTPELEYDALDRSATTLHWETWNIEHKIFSSFILGKNTGNPVKLTCDYLKSAVTMVLPLPCGPVTSTELLSPWTAHLYIKSTRCLQTKSKNNQKWEIKCF